jgi:DNA topoisomerase-1
MNILRAQQTRQIIDLLVGFRISPTLWKNIHIPEVKGRPTAASKMKLSAGRCQTPALSLVYDNQMLIDKEGDGSIHHQILGKFSKHLPFFKLTQTLNSEQDVVAFLESERNAEHIYCKENIQTGSRSAPLPFSTSTIQQEASNRFKLSPKETMDVCQSLYEDGLITYMRTDCKKYSSAFIENVTSHIKRLYGDVFLTDQMDSVTISLMDEEAHEAIRPTNISAFKKGKTPQEKKIYNIIWERTVESCMSNETHEFIIIKVKGHPFPFVNNTLTETIYECKCEHTTFYGWKEVARYSASPSPITSQMSPNAFAFAKLLNSNTKAQYLSISSSFSNSGQSLLHLTEARLVKMLENKGIGRPSTFAHLIDKIQIRGYVKKENISGKEIKGIEYELNNEPTLVKTEVCKTVGGESNKLILQPIGKKVIEFLHSQFNSLFQYEYTNQMEIELDKVSKNTSTLEKVCIQCDLDINNLIQQTDEVKNKQGEENKEPKFGILNGKPISVSIGKYGPFIKWMDELNNEQTCSLFDKPRELKTPISKTRAMDSVLNATREEILTRITQSSEKKEIDKKNYDASIVRVISGNISIRISKTGEDYIFFKKTNSNRVSFFSLDKFPDNYKTCPEIDIRRWITRTYNIY